MEKNKKSGDLKMINNQIKKLNKGGMWEEDEKTKTYNQKLYYINSSGLICRLPDQVEAREEIHSEYFESIKEFNQKK